MPFRKTPLVTGQFYHIFNKSADNKPIFANKRECSISLEIINYYKISDKQKISFSKFRKLHPDLRKKYLNKGKSRKNYLIEIAAFCLIPNHYHFLLRQKQKNGVSKFIADFQNSFTRFYNIKHERKGAIFIGPFKAVLVETEPQLLHVSRYIHLNPYASYIVRDVKDIITYSWSSFLEYFDSKTENLSNPNLILSYFKKIKEYQNFVLDQAAYQRELENIKHLVFE